MAIYIFIVNFYKNTCTLLRNAVSLLQELTIPPSNNLESLKGNRLGQYSIRINNQWCICFNWENNHATNVEITDYH